jgi:hypothetical protein
MKPPPIRLDRGRHGGVLVRLRVRRRHIRPGPQAVNRVSPYRPEWTTGSKCPGGAWHKPSPKTTEPDRQERATRHTATREAKGLDCITLDAGSRTLEPQDTLIANDDPGWAHARGVMQSWNATDDSQSRESLGHDRLRLSARNLNPSRKQEIRCNTISMLHTYSPKHGERLSGDTDNQTWHNNAWDVENIGNLDFISIIRLINGLAAKD